MGRPLFSTLVALIEPSVRVAEEKLQIPTYERWNYANAFDPDADEFFEGENVVYEAFLSQEEIAMRATSTEFLTQPIPNAVLLQAARANGLPSTELPGEDERPELTLTLDNLSSSGSEDSSSDRASPVETDELLDATSPVVRRAEIDRREWGAIYDIAGLPPLPALVSSQSQARSLPTTPTRTSQFDDDRTAFAEVVPPSSIGAVDIPASPVPRFAQAVSPQMTPPGSVTPRFLAWTAGGRRSLNMSPSPTPAAPIRSLRAPRMSVSYGPPPVLRVQQ